MAGLPRSAVSFRRQGSSGLIWDDRLFSGELRPSSRQEKPWTDNELRQCKSVGSVGMLERNRMTGPAYPSRVVNSSPGSPPSPKFHSCGLCGMLMRSKHKVRKS
ncbi:hypothetical protein AMTRI_Chr05g71390 [Amborella trichopoda]|uniref:Uncharacterized protein n=1 Tax=Amborella trichopoda TaxID=13333 RepID=W1P3Q9_AMBTC|nr:uncharacterized protein At1g15400 [Amborella trichopoda]ERN04517.1 hypothetical protein AMTR_s00081p00126720 [Amborella trichopoda]|eukprot:XP_006842842.1 uncharacterized protein At1g15400 [Amborella trichopoda]